MSAPPEDRESYIRDCADYIRGLKAQGRAIYSDTEKNDLTRHFRKLLDHLSLAEEESRRILRKETDGRTFRSGYDPGLMRALREHLISAILATDSQTEHLTSYRKQYKHDRYRLSKAAVNLACAELPAAGPSEISRLAELILDSAGEHDTLPSPSALRNWIRDFRERN